MSKQYLVCRGTLVCEEMSPDWDGTVPESMAKQGWEKAKLGRVRHTSYRCPVNGDGFRYSVQAVCDSTDRVIAEVPYHGPGAVSGEI